MSNWNIPPPTYDAHSTTTSYFTTTLTPYLQLPHLLSLTWLAYPILSLIFIAFRLQLSLTDAQNAIVSAKDDLLASCRAAEEAATSAASMPRYLAIATNQQFAEAVNGSMNAARATLVLSLTVMEAIINFIIDIYRSTLLCFIELVVRGGLAILISAVQELNQVIQTVTSGLRTSIQNDITSANSIIKTAIDGINKVNPFGDISAPEIKVPSLDGLQNVALPASFEEALTKLNASIPSFQEIKDKVEAVIDTPFELLKKDINDTFAGITFNPDGLPVPEQNRLTFCTDLDTSVIDDIGRDFIKTAKIGVVILILVALLLIGLNCLLTWYKWRCMKNHLEYTRQAWMTDPTMVHTKSFTSTTMSGNAPQITLSDHNLLMLQANSEHPLITKITNKLSAKLRLTPSQHTHMQWFLNYIFHAPALACFLIGFFGLLSVELQLLAMGPLVAKYQARSAAAVSDFSTTIASSINSSMYNQSSLYATEVNSQVDSIQSKINDGVFGWVNGTTTTLNSTINEFYTDVQAVVKTVFGGTILEGPADEFLRCFIGSKVDAIENALTFLHDNLHVDMPRVNQTILILSPESVNEATRPIAAAAIGGTSSNGQDDGGIIGKLVNRYAEALRKERVMFGIFLGLWGLVVLMGICIVLWHSYGRSYLEKRGKRRYEKEQRAGFEDIRASPYVVNGAGNAKGAARSLNTLPEARRSVFRPFWASNTNLHEGSPNTSQESVAANDRPWETAFAQPSNSKPTAGWKLLAIGRKAIRGEPLQKDEEAPPSPVPATVQEVPLTPAPGQVQSNEPYRNTAWFGRMTGILSRKDTKKEADSASVEFWDKNAGVTSRSPMEEKPKPNLQVYTRETEQQDQLQKSRWSSSPEATQTTWMNVLSPSKKTQPQQPAAPAVVSPQTETNNWAAYPYPPIGIPIRKQNAATTEIPLDVGPVYDDPFMSPPPLSPRSATQKNQMPMPLYNGFDSQQQHTRQRSYPSPPPRHPGRPKTQQIQEFSPPPPLKSPRMFQYPTALAPPPREARHTRSTSMGAVTTPTTPSQWRVTNAAPGDSPQSSSTSLTQSPQPRGVDITITRASNGSDDMAITPVTRLLTTTHARQSSSVNPFITPFDDEHRVRIDQPSAEGLRKSMQTNPFAVSM